MTAPAHRHEHDRDPRIISAVEHFPGQNPHPVMRVGDDGRILYANDSSRPLLEVAGIELGDRLPPDWLKGLGDATRTGRPMSLPVGARTFELLAIHLDELGFTNVYGTDVTAERAIVKFPDQNPNPVFRLTWDGALAYANPASRDLLDGLGATVGEAFPEALGDELLEAARAGDRRTVDAASHQRRYALLAVDVPEFGFVNADGPDVGAERAIVKFPDQNPNPVFRLTWDGALAYANPASRDLLDGLGATVGEAFPEALGDELLAAARAGERRTVEAASHQRRYALLAVDVPEFGFVNADGPDVGAERAIV